MRCKAILGSLPKDQGRAKSGSDLASGCHAFLRGNACCHHCCPRACARTDPPQILNLPLEFALFEFASQARPATAGEPRHIVASPFPGPFERETETIPRPNRSSPAGRDRAAPRAFDSCVCAVWVWVCGGQGGGGRVCSAGVVGGRAVRAVCRPVAA